MTWLASSIDFDFPLPATMCKTRPEGHRARSMRGLLCLALLGSPSANAAAFDLQGHRGARGLAPENTMAAFATALRTGVSTLELDLGMSRDGVLVVAHDPRLNPAITRDAEGRWLVAPTPTLWSLDVAELRRYDVGRIDPASRYAAGFTQQQAVDGERLPTLDGLFTQVKAWGANEVRFNIETKIDPTQPQLTAAPTAFVKALLALVEQHGLRQRVSVQSFDWRTLKLVQAQSPDIATVALTAQQRWLDNVADARWTAGLKLADFGGSVPRLVKASGAHVWSPYFGDLNEALLAEAHALGLKVVPWTVNDSAQIEGLLQWPLDGIISDYPDRVRQLMAQRGMALPAPLNVR
jgi:glycerophosphoryl diester phosphodiesterase